MPTPEEVFDAFQKAGLNNIITFDAPVETFYHDPDKVVQHFIQGLGWFGEELSQLPWKARNDLIKELKEKERNVCRKYSDNERIINFPNQMVKGLVPARD